MTKPFHSFWGYFRMPISVRLTLWYGLSMVVLLLLFAGLLATNFHRNQHLVLHQRLFKTQAELMPQVVIEDGVPRLSPPLRTRRNAFEIEEPFDTFVRLLSPEGVVWDRSANFEGREGLQIVLQEEGGIYEVSRDWEGHPYRSLYAPIRVDGALVGWLEVSGMGLNLHQQIQGGGVWLAVLVTVLLALVGGYVLSRRALRPVVRLNEAAALISASALHIRLPLDASFRDELTDLAETFNTMIARLEGAFERERRFTANAAHELLNPLAAVRNEIEVTLRRERTNADYQTTLVTIQADVVRLSRMVEQLLDLARLDGVADLPDDRVDLGRLATEWVARWQATAQAQQITLRVETQAGAVVAVHPAHLETVLDNLLDNALKYTPSGGSVAVQIQAEEEYACLKVTDTGIGFDSDAAERLFDRFYRADTPEVQAHTGSGLGLALVRAIVEAYGGYLTASSPGMHQGSVFTLWLPSAM